MSRVPQTQVRRLEAALKLAENRECFDCAQRQPRWASTNLGVFFCLRCAGVHRSLGVHISKVKSTNMDTWDEDMIQRCEKIGNGNGKLLYLASVPAGYGKPAANCDDQVIKRAICQKYEQRAYYASNVDELFEQLMSRPGPATPVAVSPVSPTPSPSSNINSSGSPAVVPAVPAGGGNGNGMWGEFKSSPTTAADPFSSQQQTAFKVLSSPAAGNNNGVLGAPVAVNPRPADPNSTAKAGDDFWETLSSPSAVATPSPGGPGGASPSPASQQNPSHASKATAKDGLSDDFFSGFSSAPPPNVAAEPLSQQQQPAHHDGGGIWSEFTSSSPSTPPQQVPTTATVGATAAAAKGPATTTLDCLMEFSSGPTATAAGTSSRAVIGGGVMRGGAASENSTQVIMDAFSVVNSNGGGGGVVLGGGPPQGVHHHHHHHHHHGGGHHHGYQVQQPSGTNPAWQPQQQQAFF